MGTPQYMAPEQWRGQKNIDGRTDVYALGAILYEMLTSQLPFEGESTATLIYKHVYKNPTSPRKLRPEMSIPASVEQVVLRAMAKKPTDRFKDMRELEQALVVEEMALSPPSETTGHTAFIYRPSGPPPWLRWAALGGAVSSLIFGLLWLALRPGTPTVQAAPDLGSRPALLADLARPAPPADLSVPPVPDAATAPTGPANPSGPSAGGSETPPETPGPGPGPGPGPKTRPAHGGRSYAVRLTVEPAAVQAVATCRGRRISCRGSCQLAVPESGGCTVHANGYQDLSLRARDVKGKRALRVVMRALKLGR